MMAKSGTETVLWATRKGDEDWQEELITSTSDPKRLADAKKWAMEHGFDRLRTSTFREGDRPDFAGTVRKNPRRRSRARRSRMNIGAWIPFVVAGAAIWFLWRQRMAVAAPALPAPAPSSPTPEASLTPEVSPEATGPAPYIIPSGVRL